MGEIDARFIDRRPPKDAAYVLRSHAGAIKNNAGANYALQFSGSSGLSGTTIYRATNSPIEVPYSNGNNLMRKYTIVYWTYKTNLNDASTNWRFGRATDLVYGIHAVNGELLVGILGGEQTSNISSYGQNQVQVWRRWGSNPESGWNSVWSHFVWVVDMDQAVANTVRLFVNGVKIGYYAGNNASTPSFTNNRPLYLGSCHATIGVGGQMYFQDLIFLNGHAVSDAEAIQLYKPRGAE